MSAASRLTRTLAAMAEAAGCAVRVAPLSETPWASATFVGARHVLAIESPGSATFYAWLATLPDADFAVRGHVVVEVSVERQAGVARMTALILEGA